LTRVSDELVVELEALEHAALLDVHSAATPIVAVALGLSVAELGDGVCTACSSVPSNAYMNRLRGLSVRGPLDSAVLDAATAFFRSRPVAAFGIDVAAGSSRDDLVALLTSRGFVHASTAAKLIRRGDLATRRADTFDIVDVSKKRAEDFASVWVRGLPAEPGFTQWMAALPGRSGWTCKVAYRAMQPVACAASRIDENGRCWLGFSATLLEHRRQGAQSALLADLLTHAARLGCDLAATETAFGRGDSAASLRNVIRAGFEVAYTRELYVSPEP
jgi:GNAT superfamily N-acetyltransferase